jgi:hypothetical protein
MTIQPEVGTPVQIVNPDPKYGKVKLREPTTLGYVYVAATVKPGPLPFILPSRERSRLLAQLKEIAGGLTDLDPIVVAATVFRATVMPPPPRSNSYLKERGDAVRVPRFDVAVLVETTSPAAAHDVQQTSAFQALMDAIAREAERTYVMAARNARRIGDVDHSRKGLFLFNHFVADDAERALELWDYLADWYAVETGLDNSILLAPLGDGPSDYVFVNHARWDESIPRLMWRQLAKKSFRTYVMANLEANRVGSMPVLYRLA